MCLLFTIQARSGPKSAQHPTANRCRGPVQAWPRAEPRPSSARRPRVARQLAAWPPSPVPSRPVPHPECLAVGRVAKKRCHSLQRTTTRRHPSPEQSTPYLSACLSSARCAAAPSPFSSAPAPVQAVAVHSPAARARRQSCPQPPTLAALQPAAWWPCSGDQGIHSPPTVRRKNPRSLAPRGSILRRPSRPCRCPTPVRIVKTAPTDSRRPATCVQRIDSPPSVRRKNPRSLTATDL